MTKKLFRNAILFFTFVLGGIFLNSCANLSSDKIEETVTAKIATVSFAISDLSSDTEARTVLPNSDDHDLKKYLYLYNYTLTYVNENGEEEEGEENIICNDFSYDKFIKESTIRLATGKKYKFSLKAKDGEVTRMEGSTIITLSEKPEQKVTIVLMPAGEEYGQKLRVDWVVPDDGVITTMKAGISPERGYAESQTEDEIRDLLQKALNKDRKEEELSELVEKFKFHEYSFSIIDNPFAADDPRKAEYGSTVKRIGVTYDDVKTGVARWLDYKFYDANGVLVYESSESVYMIGGKTSSSVIYITPDHYYRRPVTIPVNKDGNLWANNPDLEVKLVDKNGNEYILKPVLDEHGNPTGEFEGLLPGKSSGDGSTEATDGIFDIYVGLDGNEGSGNAEFIKTGAEYDANTGTITGNGGEGIGSGSTDTVELVTVPVPQPEDGVNLTPTGGVVGTNGTVGDGSGNGGFIVPAGQDFTVKVEVETGYGADGGDGTITVGGKPAKDGEEITLNTKDNDLTGGIKTEGVKKIVYGIVYKTQNELIKWKNGYAPSEAERTFTIESDDITLPPKDKVAEAKQISGMKCNGWWFGNGEAENNLDNIVQKLNKEKALREKVISYAVSKEEAYSELDSSSAATADKYVILNVYWIPSDYVEYRIEYKFENLEVPSEYVTDNTVVDEHGNKVVSFHNVALEENKPATIPNDKIKIPEVPGFTHPDSITIDVGTVDGTQVINYTRKDISITLDVNGGNWTDGTSTDTKILNGKFGKAHAHVDDPVREDYKFLGWYVKGDSTQTPIKHVDNHTFPAESIEYMAKWEQTHANYTVEFYYEKVDSTYEKKSTHTVKGVIGTFPAFNTTPQPGFTFNDHKRSITAGGANVTAIRAEGDTLVKLYFDRKTVTFTLKSNGGKFTDGNGNTTEEIVLEGKYGSSLPTADSRGFNVAIPQPPVLEGINDDSINDGDPDFTFNAWHVRTESDLEAALPSTFPAENSIYAARWNQINGIYKIVHWAESMDRYADGSYKLLAPKAIDGFNDQMLEGSVTKKGKIGSTMVYYHQTGVKGFKDPTVEIRNSTGTITGNADADKITADEKTEIIVTYLRKDYTIRFHLNAGGDTNAKWCGVDAGSGSSETVARTGKYRIDFTQPENPVREHFIFRGWVTTPAGTLADRVDVVPSYTEEAPKDYYAVWYSKASGGLETDTSDIGLTCSVTGNVITANVHIPEDAGEWIYSWSVNNYDGGEHGKVLTVSDCLKKDYEITVVATHNGKIYTKTETVTVR
ncbi:MAG: InlB B-repeat-containing protein [Treponema sp.]|nr:InlB B-repeat-containing protein [Candidatus Treponema equifaecale]